MMMMMMISRRYVERCWCLQKWPADRQMILWYIGVCTYVGSTAAPSHRSSNPPLPPPPVSVMCWFWGARRRPGPEMPRAERGLHKQPWLRRHVGVYCCTRWVCARVCMCVCVGVAECFSVQTILCARVCSTVPWAARLSCYPVGASRSSYCNTTTQPC